MKNSGITNVIESIFDVQKIQLTPSLEGYEMPQSYGIYNATTKNCLGVVGSQYVPTQPADILSNFLEAMEAHNISDEKIEYNELKGGSKIIFSAPFNTVTFTNMKGNKDESIVTLNYQTGYDGLTKSSLFLSTFRMICSNGMKANKTEFNTSFKNTAGNVQKMSNLIGDVSKSIAMFSELDSLIKHLNTVKVTSPNVRSFVNALLEIKVDEELSTRKTNIINDLMTSIDLEFNRTGASA